MLKRIITVCTFCMLVVGSGNGYAAGLLTKLGNGLQLFQSALNIFEYFRTFNTSAESEIDSLKKQIDDLEQQLNARALINNGFSQNDANLVQSYFTNLKNMTATIETSARNGKEFTAVSDMLKREYASVSGSYQNLLYTYNTRLTPAHTGTITMSKRKGVLGNYETVEIYLNDTFMGNMMITAFQKDVSLTVPVTGTVRYKIVINTITIEKDFSRTGKRYTGTGTLSANAGDNFTISYSIINGVQLEKMK